MFKEHGAYKNLHHQDVNEKHPGQITVKDVYVGIIDSHSGIFNNFDFDAIIGMAYKYRTTDTGSKEDQPPTFFD